VELHARTVQVSVCVRVISGLLYLLLVVDMRACKRAKKMRWVRASVMDTVVG